MKKSNWIYLYGGFFLIYVLLQFAHADTNNMYLKLSGETIMGHDYHSHGAYNTVIPLTKLADTKGYLYKYSNNSLVLLTQQERGTHPLVIENSIFEEMNRVKNVSEKTARINRGGVNSNLLHLIKRLKPNAVISLSKKVQGDGKSLYERLQMSNKPTFQELQDELIIYKAELIDSLGG